MARTTPLTDPAIARALREVATTGQRRELPDPHHRGLWLRIGKSGSKSWALRARDPAGKQHWVHLGFHPEVRLAAARRAATAMLITMRETGRPRETRRRGSRAPVAAQDGLPDTLMAVLELYVAQVGREQIGWRQHFGTVKRVFAPLLSQSLATLSASKFQIVADSWPSKATANLAVSMVRPVLRWAAGRNYCDKALADFRRPSPPKERDRVLSREELSRLLPLVTDAECWEVYSDLFYLLLLTCVRLSVGVFARWGEIEGDLWRIPNRPGTKNQKYVVPLSRQARELLARRREAAPIAGPEDLIFRSRFGTALRLSHMDKVTKWFQSKSETANWHRHDLRRTSATWLGELGVDPHVIEAALGHADLIPSKVAGIYNRARYVPQVAAALQQLADFYDTIRFGEAEKIVAFRRPA
jgi:integrase